jgi:hAT family C-terminal dimerisation region
MARDYLSIMASTGSLEGVFSRTSDIANPRKRNRLTKQRINQLICIKSWDNIVDEDIPIEEALSDDSDFDEEELLGTEREPLEVDSNLPKSPLIRRPRVIQDDSESEDELRA